MGSSVFGLSSGAPLNQAALASLKLDWQENFSLQFGSCPSLFGCHVWGWSVRGGLEASVYLICICHCIIWGLGVRVAVRTSSHHVYMSLHTGLGLGLKWSQGILHQFPHPHLQFLVQRFVGAVVVFCWACIALGYFAVLETIDDGASIFLGGGA